MTSLPAAGPGALADPRRAVVKREQSYKQNRNSSKAGAQLQNVIRLNTSTDPDLI